MPTATQPPADWHRDPALAYAEGFDSHAAQARDGMAETFMSLCDAEAAWIVAVSAHGHELRVLRSVHGGFSPTMALHLGAWACEQDEDTLSIADMAQEPRLEPYRNESGDRGSNSWISLKLRSPDGGLIGTLNALRTDAFESGIANRRPIKAFRLLVQNLMGSASQLRLKQQQMHDLYRLTPVPLYVLDAQTRIVAMSEKFCELLGYTQDEMLGRMPREFMTEVSRAYFTRERERMWTAGGVSDLPVEFVCRGGAKIEVLMSSRVERDTAGRITRALCSIVDVTRHNQMQRDLERASRVDPLTSAWNRGWFLERLNVEVKRARRHQRPLSLIMIDVDHFKRVNDTWGHAAGDLVLQNLVATARSQLRDHDEIGRLGGEEFGILLPETPVTGAIIVAERLRNSLQDISVQHENEAIIATISAGVGEVLVSEHRDEAIARVDAALYAAKRGGRNRTVVWGQTPAPLAADDDRNSARAGSERAELGMLY